MHAVSLNISLGPTRLHVRTDKKIENPSMTCQFAGSVIPLDSPWKKDKMKIDPDTDKEKYDVIREPPLKTMGVVQWTLRFRDVSKTSKVFGNYSCSFDNVKPQYASLILAGG